jgi:hypothetical protein
MPTPLVNATIYRTTVYCTLGAQAAALPRYWSTGGSVVGTITMKQFADAVSAFLGPAYKAVLANVATYNGITCSRVTGATPYEIYDSSTVSQGIGVAGAAAMSKQTAGLIGFYTNFAGRAFRGRQYVPFPASADDTGEGKPTIGAGSYVARLGALALVLITPFVVVSGANTATLTPVIFHKGSSSMTPITAAAARLVWATQKRRGDFGKTNNPPPL